MNMTVQRQLAADSLDIYMHIIIYMVSHTRYELQRKPFYLTPVGQIVSQVVRKVGYLDVTIHLTCNKIT